MCTVYMFPWCMCWYVCVYNVGPPSKPTKPAVSKVTGTSVKLKWSTPEEDGSSAITTYQVTTYQVTTYQVTTYQVTTYQVTTYQVTTYQVPTYNVPGTHIPGTHIQCTRYPHTRYSLPPYQVEMLQEGFEDWQPIIQQPKNMFTVKTLQSNTCYRFRVLACNEYGAGEPSDPSDMITTKGRSWLTGSPNISRKKGGTCMCTSIFGPSQLSCLGSSVVERFI